MLNGAYLYVLNTISDFVASLSILFLLISSFRPLTHTAIGVPDSAPFFHLHILRNSIHLTIIPRKIKNARYALDLRMRVSLVQELGGGKVEYN